MDNVEEAEIAIPKLIKDKFPTEESSRDLDMHPLDIMRMCGLEEGWSLIGWAYASEVMPRFDAPYVLLFEDKSLSSSFSRFVFSYLKNPQVLSFTKISQFFWSVFFSLQVSISVWLLGFGLTSFSLQHTDCGKKGISRLVFSCLKNPQV